MVHVEAFFDEETSTLTYVVHDQKTLDAVLIDPVLNFDPQGSAIHYTSAKKIEAYMEGLGLKLRYILETHAHADHLSASQYFKERLPEARLGIGAGIIPVQKTFKDIFGLPSEFAADGSQFDQLFMDGETVNAGSLTIKVIATPGHTPACVSYLIDRHLFTGDVVFMPDSGTGRCDFPQGDARGLYRSIHERLYKLPDDTVVYVGHDYQPDGRPLQYRTTIGEQKRANIHLKATTSEAEYVEFRKRRDATLKAPKLLYPSLYVNIAGGRLPKPESGGRRFLKIPLYTP